jgi:hypothetical protein
MTAAIPPSPPGGTSRTAASRRVQILYLPDCPLVEPLRGLVRGALARCDLDAEIEEIEGPYASPTLLIDGVDVTGRPVSTGLACRLDLPTEEQICRALSAAAQ